LCSRNAGMWSKGLVELTTSVLPQFQPIENLFSF
jgi:hypothetical protein